MKYHTYCFNLGRGASLLCATFLLLMTSPTTMAQSPGDNEGDVIEEVIVTARKLGAEKLQDIPAAISALDKKALEEMRVVDFEDFARQIPGLTFLDTSPGQRRYVVRGVQSEGQQQVAVYYDEVPLPGVQSSSSNSGSQTTDLKLYDMERVEVLRGPQGTVFGANSQGGTVRFITVQPVLGEFESYVSAELSRTAPSGSNNGNFQAVVNLPISDNFAARTLVYDGEDAGYIDNNRCRATNPAEDPREADTQLSCLNEQDYNYAETAGMRTNLLWQVSNNATLKAQFWWQDRQTGGDSRYHPFDAYNPAPTDAAYAGNADSVAGFTFFEEGKFKSGDFALTPKPDEQTLYSVTGEFKLPFADLTATVSRYERDFEFKFDSTWIITFLLQGHINNKSPVCAMAGEPGCLRADLLYALTDQHQTLEQDAFEFRFNSKDPDSPIQWVAGGFLRNRVSDFQSYVPVIATNGATFSPATPPTLPPPNEIGAGIPGCHPCVFARSDSKDIEESAIFGEVNWAINDAFDLNLGVRWFNVDQKETGRTHFQFAAFAPNPPDATTPDGATPPSVNNLSDSEVPWKVALAWHGSENMTVYGLRSNGFRLGGTNNRGIGAIVIPESFEADELTNYEFGIKTLLAKSRLALNVSVFFMEWDNLQVGGQDATGAFNFIGNAGSAKIEGIEMDINTSIGENLRFNGQVTYLSKRELTEDQVTTTFMANGVKGDKIPRVPEMTASFAAYYDYVLPIPDWTGSFGISGSYHDSSFTQLSTNSSSNRYQDSYSIFNAHASFRNDNLGLDLVLFIDNITDEDGDLYLSAANGQPTSKITNRPRTAGLQVTKRFGRN